MARNEAVGKARYELETDPTKLKQGLDAAGRTIRATGAETEKAFAQQGTGAVGKFSKSVDGVVGRFNDLSKKGGLMGAIVGGAGLGVGLSAFNLVQGAVSGVLDDIGRGIDLASDKAEAASRANILFGDSYHIIEKASRSAATTVGMSSGAYLTAAGNLGNLITNFGITGDAGAKMSKELVQLAADMGSFNNASTEEVTQAMGSAFVGETEPIRRFGVMLSAADIAARAVALGLAESTKSVSQAAKVQATYSLILEQTTKAQGDFARTSDGYANSQRIQAAKTEEALTRLGDAILPLAQELMPMLAEAGIVVVEVLTAAVGVLKSLGDGMRALNEFFKPWEREAREAREQTTAWADELAKMPEASRISRAQLEAMARAAQLTEEGLAGAKLELIDFVRWQRAMEEPTELRDLLLTISRYQSMLEKGTITQVGFDNKMRQLALTSRELLEPALDLLPESLQRVITGLDQEVVDRFVDSWTRLSKAFPGGGEQWERFIASNLETITEHFDMLPVHIQEAMVRAGIVVREGAENTSDLLGTMADMIRESVERAADLDIPVARGVRGAVHAMSLLGPGLRSQLDQVEADMEQARKDLLWALENPRAWAATIRRIENRIEVANSREARAVASGNREKAALWAGYRAYLVGEWESTTRQSHQAGERITKRHGKGLHEGAHGKGGAIDQAELANTKVKARLRNKGGVKDGGNSLVVGQGSWLDGILAGLQEAWNTLTADGGLLDRIAGLWGGSLPEEGPLVGSWHGGGDLVRQWGREAEGALPDVERRLSAGFEGLAGRIQTPRFAGFSVSSAATQTVTHEHRGRVEVALSGATIAAAREQGASWEDVGHMASAAGDLSAVLARAQRTAGTRYLGPVGGTI